MTPAFPAPPAQHPAADPKPSEPDMTSTDRPTKENPMTTNRPTAVAYQGNDGRIWERLTPNGPGTDWVDDIGNHYESYGALLDAEEPLTSVHGWCEWCEQPVLAGQRFTDQPGTGGLLEHTACATPNTA